MSVVKNILKQWYEEPMTVGLSLFPILISLVFRFLWDPIVQWLPGAASYKLIVQMCILMLNPFLLGWAWGFLFLEDKDQGILPILEISPMGYEKMLLWKALFSLILSIVLSPISLIILGFNSILGPSIFFVSILLAIQGPMIYFSLALFANNRVQGLTIGKLLSLFLLIPLAQFLFPSPWNRLVLIFPNAWWGKVFIAFLEGQNPLPASILCILLSCLYTILLWLGRKKIIRHITNS